MLFPKLLRHSKFMQLGEFQNKLLVGKIVRRNVDDLYIDVGLKFNAVCKVPQKDEIYGINSKVVVKLLDTELSERFLGSRYDLTLLEADAILLGLYEKMIVQKDKLIKQKNLNLLIN